jgi:hypothetical protein
MPIGAAAVYLESVKCWIEDFSSIFPGFLGTRSIFDSCLEGDMNRI